MRRITSSMAIGALALSTIGLVGGTAAAATTPTLTLTQPTVAAVNGAPFTLTATASEAGSVAFTANSTPIPGCATELTAVSGTSFVATCPWTPALTATSPVTIGATLTANVVTDGTAAATTVNVNVTPVSLAGSAIYLGANEKLVATTYSAGTVVFSQGGTPITGCESVVNALNANRTAYAATCTITSPAASAALKATFTPINNTYTSGFATYNMVVNTVVASGGAGAVVGAPSTITVNANMAGTVGFTANSTPITGCTAVATTSTSAPYVYTCAYTPAAIGTAAIVATLTPAVGSPEVSNSLNVTASAIVLSGGAAIFGVSPGTIVSTSGAAGTVTFYTMVGAAATPITGCVNVDTLGVSAPFTALCTWTPSAAGPAVLSAALTLPKGVPGGGGVAANLSVTVGVPIQGQQYPISMYVDTIMSSGATGTATSPTIGAGCEITNEFLLGQTIVFRVYGNDAQLNGAPLTPVNVASATIKVAGWSGSPITMAYGSHGGQAFWTGVLATGTKTGQYSTLGVIPYTVTFTTNTVPAIPGVPAVTKVVPVYVKKLVTVKVGKVTKKVWKMVLVGHKTVIVKAAIPGVPAIPGATGTFNSAFNPASQATLNAIPTVS